MTNRTENDKYRTTRKLGAYDSRSDANSRGVRPKAAWKHLEKYEGLEKPTMYITSATVNLCCPSNMAAFFIRMDRMYSRGETGEVLHLPVKLLGAGIKLIA